MPSTSLIMQMLDQHHVQAEAGHARLRLDVRQIEQEIDRIIAEQAALASKISKVETKPLDIEQVSFSTKQMTLIVGAALSIALGMWQLHSGITDLQDSILNAAKLQDERNETTKQALDQLRANLEMRRVEIQNLSNFIQQNVRQGAKP